MPTAAVRDIEIHYDIAGDGAPVLLISGTGADLRDSPVSSNPLTKHFRVIAYDQRGLGQTSKPDLPYTMSDYADDAAGLLDALGIARAHVVGISFGGMVAQHLAIRHPSRLERLILACTSPGGRHSSADLLALAELPEAERAETYLPLADTRVQPGEPLPDGLADVLALVGKRRRPATAPDAVMGSRRQLEARAQHDVCEQLGAIAAPTLVIGGRYDGIAPVPNLDALAAGIPDSQLRLCEGGHMFLLHDRSAWPAIIEFLGSEREAIHG